MRMRKAKGLTRRKALPAAVGSALLLASGMARAVYEDPHGVGQVLIYPYYTVQSAGGNAFNTYLSVTNTTTRAKAVKVRFREGRNGRAVLDFNLYLSSNDVWTAAMGPADASAGAPAMLVTADKSCTAPPIPAAGMPFNNFRYSGVNADFGPTTLDRTREGYFEVIEMANLTGLASTAVTHTAAGTPANCGIVQGANGFTAAANGASFLRPSGGLAGAYTVINVANGLNFGGNATALAQFSSTPIFTDPGSDMPDLGSANPPRATTVAANFTGATQESAATYIATYANGRDAVSASLMRYWIANEYVLDAATKSATDWVLTFPTKGLYVAPGTGVAVPPFTSNFGSTGSCESFSFALFNRETSNPQSGASFPEAPPPGPSDFMCWAAQVLTFGAVSGTPAASSVFGSANSVARSVNNFQNGWALIFFPGAGPFTGVSNLPGTGTVLNARTGTIASTTATIKFQGLPVIGFMARTLNNGALSCTTFGGTQGVCAGSYGAAFDHKYAVSATLLP